MTEYDFVPVTFLLPKEADALKSWHAALPKAKQVGAQCTTDGFDWPRGERLSAVPFSLAMRSPCPSWPRFAWCRSLAAAMCAALRLAIGRGLSAAAKRFASQKKVMFIVKPDNGRQGKSPQLLFC